MRISLSKWLTLVVAVWFTVALSGCGGGGGDIVGGGGGDTMGGNPSEPPTLQPGPLPPLPNQQPGNARNAPVAYDGRSLNVNPTIAPAPGAVPAVGEHHGVRVAYGRVDDGVGAAHLIDYLSDDVRQSGGRLAYFGTMPPTIHIVEGATPEMIDQTVRAVQLINAALPREWRLKVGDVLVSQEIVASLDEPVPACRGLECLDAPPPNTPSRSISRGNILVQFAAGGDWAGLGGPENDPNIPGRAELSYSGGLIWSARVWVDPVRGAGANRMVTLLHEIIHTLGRQHADPQRFPATVMHAVYESGNAGEGLHPLDREALLAVYGALGPHATLEEVAESLGPWQDASMHVRGALDAGGGEVAFGVGLRNGLARPWASGPAPLTNIKDGNLSGSATWSGRLLGLTPAMEVVGGGAGLTIQLDTLDGALDFTDLESWPSGGAPVGVGTGALWGDGDLNYQVSVRGNTFVRTGGDPGEVTGAFFGGSHEAMGGVVERNDLTAGFGGKR